MTDGEVAVRLNEPEDLLAQHADHLRDRMIDSPSAAAIPASLDELDRKRLFHHSRATSSLEQVVVELIAIADLCAFRTAQLRPDLHEQLRKHHSNLLFKLDSAMNILEQMILLEQAIAHYTDLRLEVEEERLMHVFTASMVLWIGLFLHAMQPSAVDPLIVGPSVSSDSIAPLSTSAGRGDRGRRRGPFRRGETGPRAVRTWDSLISSARRVPSSRSVISRPIQPEVVCSMPRSCYPTTLLPAGGGPGRGALQDQMTLAALRLERWDDARATREPRGPALLLEHGDRGLVGPSCSSLNRLVSVIGGLKRHLIVEWSVHDRLDQVVELEVSRECRSPSSTWVTWRPCWEPT